MKDELEQLLKSLHLRRVAELFEEESKRAEKQKPTYEEFCTRLMRAQWQRNQETSLAYRIKQARMPESLRLLERGFRLEPNAADSRFEYGRALDRKSTRLNSSHSLSSRMPSSA